MVAERGSAQSAGHARRWRQPLKPVKVYEEPLIMDMDVDVCSILYDPWTPEESEANESMDNEEDSDSRMVAGADAQDVNKGHITPPSKEDIAETSAVEGRNDQLHGISRTDLSEDGGDDRFFEDAEEYPDVADLEALLNEDDLEDEAVLGGIEFWRNGRKPAGWKEGRDGSIHIQTERQEVKILKEGRQIYIKGMKSLSPTPQDICGHCSKTNIQAREVYYCQNCKFAHFCCSQNRKEEKPLTFEGMGIPLDFIKDFKKRARLYQCNLCSENQYPITYTMFMMCLMDEISIKTTLERFNYPLRAPLLQAYFIECHKADPETSNFMAPSGTSTPIHSYSCSLKFRAADRYILPQLRSLRYLLWREG